MPKNPWVTHDSRVVYQNSWITVREDRVTRPDGQPGIYGVVSPQVATGVVALTPDQQIYMVGQWRYALERYSWEIIEGGAEPGESPLQGAKRELEEEAGLVAHSWKKLGGEIHLSNSISDEVAWVFMATDLKEVPRAPDGTELLEVKKVPFSRAMEMVNQGEITDAMSLIALHRAALVLKARA